MGMDNYIYITPDEPACISNPKAIEIYHMRRDYSLHRFMKKLYRDKGGTGDFSPGYLLLTNEDLDRLDAYFRSSILLAPFVKPFILAYTRIVEGEDEYACLQCVYDDLREGEEIDLILVARQAIANGGYAFYIEN